jgi:hypothetical protein
VVLFACRVPVGLVGPRSLLVLMHLERRYLIVFAGRVDPIS